ncbi:MAG: GAF domain-containing protein [Chloroflexia bacterium]
MARKKATHQETALEVVCNIGRAVAAEMDLPSLLELIYRETGRVMDTDCFTIGLYDPLEEALRFDIIYDRGERLPVTLLRKAKGWGLAGRVFESRTSLLFTDLAETGLPPEAIPLGEVPRSWLGVPLIARERAIGVMSVQSYEPAAFGPDDQRLLEAIASQAAVALENLFLRREHERRIAELSALNEIGRAIITTTHLEDILEAIYRETSRVMDTSNLYVALYHPEEEKVTFDYFMEDGRRVEKSTLYLRDGGLTVHIVQTRQPLLLGEDLERELAELGIRAVGRPAKSYLGVPMLIGDRVIGVIAVQSPDRPRAYDRRHLDLLTNIANLAAVAIENARMAQDRERRITELSILNEIGRAVSSTLELDPLLEVIHQQVRRLFDTTNFYIATYEEGTDEWTLVFQIERGKRLPPTTHKVRAGLTGYIIRNRKPLLLRNLQENLAFKQAQNIPPLGEQALSWLGVPLLAADKVVGVMAIQSYEQENLYDEEDLALFSTIAGQVAVALQNARLFRELGERLADLTILNEVAQAILTAESEEELLKAIHRQVGRVMDATNFYVALYDEARQEMDFAYFVEEGQHNVSAFRRSISEGGLTAHIIQARRPLFLEKDVDARLAELGIVGKGRPAKCYMGVPMLVGEQVVGAMAVQSYEREEAFTPRHLALLTNIATQAALAVQRLRLRESESRKARHLAIIGEVSRKVTAILDLDELLRELARSIQLGFGFDNVAVFRVDEQTREAVLGALVGRYAGILDWGYRQPLDEGLIGWAIRNGRTVLCNNVLEDPRYIRGFDAEERTRAELCVPISFANRVIGALDIQAEEENAFDAEDVAAMETLAGQLAAAMRNAILFRERGEQLANLNALNRVIQATATAMHLEDMITSLCDVIVELMSPDGFFLALRNPQTGELRAPLVMDEGVFYRDIVLGEKGFTGYLLQTGAPVFIRNMVEEAAKYPVERSTMGSGKPVASWLGVPLRSGEQVVGAIVVQSYRPFAFDEQDLNFLQAVSSQVVVSLEKARLFEETQRTLEELRAANEQQKRLLDMVRELSTPLMPIAEGILVLPLVGTVDSQRATQIMEVLLEGVTNQRARAVILDITGVPVVDTSVANYLLQATRAVRLLGAECILVGITPEVAQTVVGLGVDLSGLVTRSDLQGGVEYALRLLGQRIVKPKRSPGPPLPSSPEVRTPPPAPPVL